MVCKAWKEHSDYLNKHPHWVTALSDAENFSEAIKTVFARCSVHAFRPNVAFLFVSDTYNDALDANVIEAELSKLPPLHLGGATGSGIIGHGSDQLPVELEPTEMDDGSQEPIKAVSLALACVPGASVDSFCVKDDEEADAMVATLQNKLSGPQSRSACFVVLADAKTHVQGMRLEKLVQTLDREFPQSEITGGLASAFRRTGSRVLWGEKGGTSGVFGSQYPKGDKGVNFVKGASTIISLITSDDSLSSTPGLETPHPLTYASVARRVSAVGPCFTVTAVEGPAIVSVQLQDANGQVVGENMPIRQAVRLAEEHPSWGGGMYLLCGIANVPSPNSSQLKMHQGLLADFKKEIEGSGGEVVQKEGLILDMDEEDALPVGCTLRFMVNGGPEDMEVQVQEQMRWTQEWLSSRPGFGNRVVTVGEGMQEAWCEEGSWSPAVQGGKAASGGPTSIVKRSKPPSRPPWASAGSSLMERSAQRTSERPKRSCTALPASTLSLKGFERT
eukprot:CAMPEP_0181294532 /NCGR_PEP_ID=MMETSP1101-20121128/3653_1 /TAXON_ID=46948 /ORGANISM="Rhodomonas abbreviata, Strain Caron Lab Isolate" /LENGTH=502 /DNA_ID=CAMNT_0023399201 /DNA_START=183 /DNA_END=1688 /DNA_ORIENTATION=-